MGQGDSASVLTRAKVWKTGKYWMYFPFFILHDWDKKSAEARCPHCAVLPLLFFHHFFLQLASAEEVTADGKQARDAGNAE